MTDHSGDEAAESGALDESADPGSETETSDRPVESGGLLEEQERKGYGADEGEREQSL